ncbi:M6 family metalloprotease domain-containing protein [Nocardia sp. FBN12]|uniref:M6 family metalloprotease domain-containing protein n=1 Tax=Nocardia sp. FBN12 TaxID=3419766 RepID=UPI003D03C4E4
MPRPFAGEEFSFTEPDGAEIRLRGWGNQFEAVFETPDGYTVVEDPATGYQHYATLSEDGTDLVATEARPGEQDPRSLGLTPHLRRPAETAKQAARDAYSDGGVPPRWVERRALAQARRAAEGEAAPELAPATGDCLGLCVLVEFPDVPGTISRGEVDDFCNKPGYTGFGNNGSVSDYFRSVSDGRLRYRNTVTAYYRTQHPRAYYTDPSVPFGTRAQQLIHEALNSLAAGGFDFSALTADSAGNILALNVFYAGNRVNQWSKGLWPHQWTLQTTFPAGPGRRFADYQITDIGDELTLGTFCHENGHMVCDFPDLYDYGNEGNGIGHYCLMCFGGPDKNPTQVGAYLKNVAGWASALSNATPGTSVALKAGRNEFLVHRRNPTEYFIVENRARAGHDAGLPDEGVAIWHVDELGNNSNEQMTPALHYECSLEQADNRFDLENRVNGGDTGDLYAGPGAEFGTATAPGSRWWDGSSSGFEVTVTSPVGASMTVTVNGQTDPSIRAAEQASPQDVSIG